MRRMNLPITWSMLLALVIMTSPHKVASQEPSVFRPFLRQIDPVLSGSWLMSIKVKLPEAAEMLWCILTDRPMSLGAGWFHLSQSRYGWAWLAERFDADKDKMITRKEFHEQAVFFDRLDRNHDGVLTAVDFDWSDQSPLGFQEGIATRLFRMGDADTNGRVSKEEWQALFSRKAKGKDFLTSEDLRDLLFPPSYRPPQGGGSAMPFFLPLFFREELGFFREGPSIEAAAPDFTLPTHDGTDEIRLSSFKGKKPVVLVFGSFT